MKKETCILLACLLALALAACGRTASSSTASSGASSGTASSGAMSGSQGTDGTASSGMASDSQGADSAASGNVSTAGSSYAEVLAGARTDDYNDAYSIFGIGPDGNYTAASGVSDGWTKDELQSQGQSAWEFLGLDRADVEDIAYSVSMMNVKSYGTVIVMPVAGHEKAVTDALNSFVQAQQQAQENYLPDQYEIAQKARVETLPGGEIVLAMSEDADTVLEGIRTGLQK